MFLRVAVAAQKHAWPQAIWGYGYLFYLLSFSPVSIGVQKIDHRGRCFSQAVGVAPGLIPPPTRWITWLTHSGLKP